ncbi:VOC family protein [Puniceicoccaceae bacterium K14]|nr:VOC family protein [Puniceicoccaceae bacterium K14]
MSEKCEHNHGDFSWNELSVTDPQQAIHFYQKVFGWTIEEMDMPNGKYYILFNGAEKIGGITAKDPKEANSPTAWMPYITVNDVDKAAAQIVKLGGSIILPPQDIPVENGPRLTILKDPMGATLGAITYANDTAS